MKVSPYRKASIVNYETRKKHRNICCLQYLKTSDNEFARKLDESEQLSSYFKLMTSSSDEQATASGILGDEASAMAKICIEIALLNRATFACAQMCEFHKDYHFMPNDKTIRDKVKKELDDDLEYVSQLLSRFDSPSVSYAKQRIGGWLSAMVEGDDYGEFYDSDNSHMDDDDGNMSDDEDAETNHLPNVSDNED